MRVVWCYPITGMSQQITELNQKLDKLLNSKQVFKRGIIRGVGFAVGTTIIAAIVLSVLSFVAKPVLDTPKIRNIIDTIQRD